MNTRLAAILVIATLIVPVAGYAADSKTTKENIKESVARYCDYYEDSSQVRQG